MANTTLPVLCAIEMHGAEPGHFAFVQLQIFSGYFRVSDTVNMVTTNHPCSTKRCPCGVHCQFCQDGRSKCGGVCQAGVSPICSVRFRMRMSDRMTISDFFFMTDVCEKAAAHNWCYSMKGS